MSHKLFTTILNEVFKKMNLERRNLNVDGDCFKNVHFADDINLLSRYPETLKEMLKELKKKITKLVSK